MAPAGKHRCRYCKQEYCRKQNLTRHQRTSKHKRIKAACELTEDNFPIRLPKRHREYINRDLLGVQDPLEPPSLETIMAEHLCDYDAAILIRQNWLHIRTSFFESKNIHRRYNFRLVYNPDSFFNNAAMMDMRFIAEKLYAVHRLQDKFSYYVSISIGRTLWHSEQKFTRFFSAGSDELNYVQPTGITSIEDIDQLIGHLDDSDAISDIMIRKLLYFKSITCALLLFFSTFFQIDLTQNTPFYKRRIFRLQLFKGASFQF